MERYKVLKTLRPALYGDVVLCKDTVRGDLVVVKKMNIIQAHKHVSTNGLKIREDIEQEVRVNRMLSKNGGHQNVVTMRKDFVQNGVLHFVLEYCKKGELFDQVIDAGSLDEKQAMTYFRQIGNGLQYVHANNVAHRDLSLENVLVNEHGQAQICDFGLSTVADRLAKGIVGKPYYIAPEMLYGEPYDPCMADMWSLGVMLFIMITGVPPVDSSVDSDTRFAVIQKSGVQELIRIWDMSKLFSPAALYIVSRLMMVDPNSRMTLGELLQHPYMQYQNLRERSMQFASSNRRMLSINSDMIAIAPTMNVNIETNKTSGRLFKGFFPRVKRVADVQTTRKQHGILSYFKSAAHGVLCA